jgi:hypothetical protein
MQTLRYPERFLAADFKQLLNQLNGSSQSLRSWAADVVLRAAERLQPTELKSTRYAALPGQLVRLDCSADNAVVLPPPSRMNVGKSIAIEPANGNFEYSVLCPGYTVNNKTNVRLLSQSVFISDGVAGWQTQVQDTKPIYIPDVAAYTISGPGTYLVRSLSQNLVLTYPAASKYEGRGIQIINWDSTYNVGALPAYVTGSVAYLLNSVGYANAVDLKSFDFGASGHYWLVTGYSARL